MLLFKISPGLKLKFTPPLNRHDTPVSLFLACYAAVDVEVMHVWFMLRQQLPLACHPPMHQSG